MVAGLALTLAACGGQKKPGPASDTTVPRVHITSAATSSSADYSLTGIAYDDNGVEAVTYTLNDSGPESATVTGDRFEAEVTLAPGDNRITVEAVDAAGNTAADDITVTWDAPPAGLGLDTDIAGTGDVVTISGTGLGAGGNISIGGLDVSADSWTDTEVRFTVPAGAPAGPQVLSVTAPGGMETFDLFIGVDFPEGTLEDLAGLKLAAGTAVRLGQGNFSAAGSVRLSGLSLYGRGEDLTTVSAPPLLASAPEPAYLLLGIPAGVSPVWQDLTLDLGLVLTLPTFVEPGEPLDTPELQTLSSLAQLPSLADFGSSLLSPAHMVLAAAAAERDEAGLTFRNVRLERSASDAAMLSAFDMFDIVSPAPVPIFMNGRMVFDGVTSSDTDLFLLLGAREMDVSDSDLLAGSIVIVSAGAPLRVDSSAITAEEGSVPGPFFGGAGIALIAPAGVHLTGSEFSSEGELAAVFIDDSGGGMPTLTMQSSVISGTVFRATDPAEDIELGLGLGTVTIDGGTEFSAAGSVSLAFVLAEVLLEDSVITAGEMVTLDFLAAPARLTGVEISAEDQVRILAADHMSRLTVTESTFTSGDHVDFTLEDGAELVFTGNEMNFTAPGGLGLLTSGVHTTEDLTTVLLKDNVVTGAHADVALYIDHGGLSEVRFVIQDNVFTDFDQALYLAGRAGSDPFIARINGNHFDFPITASPQAAEVIDLTVANADLDATRNIWGDNTDAAVVEGFVEYAGSDTGILKISPVSVP